MASFPHRKIQALEDFKHKAAASAVTLGRASKIIATTPNGVRIFSILRPLGREPPPIISPMGSGNAATSRTPLEISASRSGVSRKRSVNAWERPFSFAADKST